MLMFSNTVGEASHGIRYLKQLPEVPGELNNQLLPPQAVSILLIILIS